MNCPAEDDRKRRDRNAGYRRIEAVCNPEIDPTAGTILYLENANTYENLPEKAGVTDATPDACIEF